MDCKVNRIAQCNNFEIEQVREQWDWAERSTKSTRAAG